MTTIEAAAKAAWDLEWKLCPNIMRVEIEWDKVPNEVRERRVEALKEALRHLAANVRRGECDEMVVAALSKALIPRVIMADAITAFILAAVEEK